jgi:glycosyltransferase involved in cell wall biosynthesis
MNDIPEITVLMPVYNGIPFLQEAVESILRQTFGNFTFLVIDDGSTDGSEKYLDQLRDSRVRVVHQSNRGCGGARKVGLRMCDSEFVAMMDADDVAVPRRLETQLDFLRRHPDVGLVGTQISFLGAGGRTGFSPPMPCDHQEIYTDLIRGRLALRHPTVTCRTSVMKGIGGYRIDRDGEDYGMFLRMGEVSKLANLEDVFLLYRMHLGNVSANSIGLIRSHIAHECCCAHQRARGLPEVTFDAFTAQRTLCQRMADRMDAYALTHYWRAMAEILSAKELRGYARLAWSAVCSPHMTWQRFCREARKLRQRIGGAKRPSTKEPYSAPAGAKNAQ